MRRRAANGRRQVKQVIARMARIIVRRFHPDKVILFGSHARGTAGPHSDVDLLVVMPLPRGASRGSVQIEIRRSLASIAVPTDIIVSTPAEFAWRKQIPGTIERPAAIEGQVLFAAAS